MSLEPDQKDFIFKSESSKRWNLLIVLSVVLAVLFGLVTFFLGLGLYANPHLPNLGTKETDELSHIRPSETMSSPKGEFAITDTNEKFLQQEIAYKDDVYAFYVNWDSNSEQSLRENIDAIDVLIPQ